MILSKSTRDRILAMAALLDRMAQRLRKFARDTTPKRKRDSLPEAQVVE